MYALVRGVSSSLPQAEMKHAVPIDVERARAQHGEYVRALRAIGLEVVVLPPEDLHPDACFVEDCAVVGPGVALIPRLGAPSRRGEEIAVASVLMRHLRLEHMTEPATLDGGDCMRVGRRLFIGRSARTNDAGIACARRVFEPLGLEVVSIDVEHQLHLKSVCSPLDDRRVLLAEGHIAARCFEGCEVLTVPEPEGANVVVWRDAALVASGFPASRQVVERAGLRVVEVDTSETRKADGALTCLSILF